MASCEKKATLLTEMDPKTEIKGGRRGHGQSHRCSPGFLLALCKPSSGPISGSSFGTVVLSLPAQ